MYLEIEKNTLNTQTYLYFTRMEKDQQFKVSFFKQILQNFKNKAILVDPDYFKNYFQDYREDRHRYYSELADEFFDFVLQEDRFRDQVFYTAGGSGSGKTEVLIKAVLKMGLRG